MIQKLRRSHRLSAFDLNPGDKLAGKYEILEMLGAGWEGEVYKVRERATGIVKAAKLFFPQRNLANRSVKFYARKLHKLRHCDILIRYHTQEEIVHEGIAVTFLVSEFVEGRMLERFLIDQPRGRLAPFEAAHLLHALCRGVEQIHDAGEYHGDLHAGNVVVRRRGIGFDVKLVDMYYWGRPRAANLRDDVCDLVRIFYDAVGGQPRYSRQPQWVKDVCCGLKRTLIGRKFRTAGHLKRHLETMDWPEGG